MFNIGSINYAAYPSNMLSSSKMDMLEDMVNTLITTFKTRDANGKRAFEHRWNPTTFGGGVDITTIPGVAELLEQHRAKFGVIQDPMCLIAEAMNEYEQYCTARLRLETLIETYIKAGLTTTREKRELANAAQIYDEAAMLIDTSLESLLNFPVLADEEDIEVAKAAAADEFTALLIDTSLQSLLGFPVLADEEEIEVIKAAATDEFTTLLIDTSLGSLLDFPLVPDYDAYVIQATTASRLPSHAPSFSITNNFPFELDNTSISDSEASYDSDDQVKFPADCHRQVSHSDSHQASTAQSHPLIIHLG